jgi:glucan biosynthesis protein C
VEFNINKKYDRLHGLDFCRAVFMLLGLFYHAGLIYGGSDNWRVVSLEHFWLIKNVSEFIHIFRMEAFYVISGFFYLLVFSKGRKGFAKDRISRALIPMLFCGLSINTVMNYYSYNQSYDWQSFDYFLEGQWLGHLWFLGDLIIYFFISLPLCRLIIASKPISKRMFIFLFYFGVPFFAVIGLAIAHFTFYDIFLFVSFGKVFYYYSYFIFGCFCFRNKLVFLSLLNLKVSIISFLFFCFLFSLIYFHVFELDIVNKVLEHISSGSLVLSIMGGLYVLGYKDSKWIRSFSDSSYTVYILHEPLITLSYVFVFKQVFLGSIREYILMVVGVFFVSYIFHNIFVRNNQFIKLLFNGVLYTRRKSG